MRKRIRGYLYLIAINMIRRRSAAVLWYLISKMLNQGEEMSINFLFNRIDRRDF